MASEPTTTRKLYYGGDNLVVMRGLESETVDLIYLDPPFNSKAIYKGAMGSKAEKQQFKDTWRMSNINKDELKDLKMYAPDIHSLISILGGANGESWHAYLTFMAVRLLEMRRLLKDTGSIYLHCDSTMAAPLKLLMDFIFGMQNFRSEIVWWYRKFGRGGKNFKKNHDTILYYGRENLKTQFNRLYEDFSPRTVKDVYKRILVDGKWVQKKDEFMQREHDGVAMSNTWEIGFVHSQSKERTGWKTQKPLALLKRIILASSNKGDLVLDPFCGCATACVAAEEEGRAWIGIDMDKQCAKIMKTRATGQQDLMKIWDDVLVDASKQKNVPVRKEIMEQEIPHSQRQIVKRALYEKQKGKCAAAPYCTHEIPIELMELDRIKAGKRGGKYVKGNMQLLCPRCNRVKSGGTMDALIKTLSQKQLYDDY